MNTLVMAWASRSKLRIIKRSLEKVQRVVWICITGGNEVVPQVSYEGHTRPYIPPSSCGYSINKFTPANDKNRIGEITSDGKSGDPCWKLPRDLIIWRYNLKKHFLTLLSKKSEWSKEPINLLSKNTIVWYMDRYKTETEVFWPGARYLEAIDKFRSIFQVEIDIIHSCIQKSFERQYKRKTLQFREITKLPSRRWALQSLVHRWFENVYRILMS